MSTEKQLMIPETLLIGHTDGRVEEMLLEAYLEGVVAPMSEPEEEPEALRALTIAARSYAVSTRRHARDRFDLCTTPHCQKWRRPDRSHSLDQTIHGTAGLVITHQGRIVVAPTFQQCDGRTRGSEEVWAGPIGYLHSMPCRCGHSHLQGHGLGLCRSGARAMARLGAVAEEILKHYYRATEVQLAESLPRSRFTWSLILGQVVAGGPSGARACSGLRLILSGPDGPVDAAGPTDSQGRFWFTQLPAGVWEIQLLGTPVRYRNVQTDGRNAVEVDLLVPESLAVGTSG